MTYTRRDLLKRIINPVLGAGSDSEPAALPFPPGQDILLQQDQCIAWGRGMCDRCEGACPENAIIFVGMLHPRIIPTRCTLCGDCVPVCPTQAIAIRPANERANEPGEIS